MLKAYKYKIYPNNQQKEMFAKCFVVANVLPHSIFVKSPPITTPISLGAIAKSVDKYLHESEEVFTRIILTI